MTLQSGFVNELRRVREQLRNSNCCFDIRRVSFKSASNHARGGGEGSQVCGITFSQSISQQGARKHFELQTIALLSLSVHPHADGKSGEGL